LVAGHYGDENDQWEGIKVGTVRGKGEFVGESDTQEGAAKNYDGIIKYYEERFPDCGRY
jgi:hypothetical protein